MTNALHVNANLMGASRLQTTFHECDIRVALQYTPVGDGFFGIGVLLKVPYPIYRAIACIARECARDGAFIFGKGSPDKGIVGTASGMLKKLLPQVGLRLGCLGYEQ